MILALVLGVAVGLGLAGAAFALSPLPPPLGPALAELHRRPSLEVARGTISPLPAGLIRSFGLPHLVGQKMRADLAVTERDEAWHLSWCLMVGLFGLATGPFVALAGLVAGVHLPWALPVAFSVIAGAGAAAAQLLALRSEATRRRRDFGFALSSYLDLVVVSMAAGRGVEGALSVAADAGSGFAFRMIRRSLASARLQQTTPWDALDQLGAALGITELSGLAASIRLAGSSGAKVRASIAARAKALRTRGLAEARSAAESATEAMSVPVVFLVLGFLILIAYPALVEISTQL